MSRVAVLKGGRSLERQVSLASAARVEDALERLGHEALGIDVEHHLVERLRELAPDAAFIALHGREGEDGTVQELLDILAIPYTSSGPAACIRCSDKVLAKHAMRDSGVQTPDFCAVTETAFKELGAGAALPDIARRLGYPLVVKPAEQGSSLGVKFAHGDDDLPAALIAAFSYDRKVLLEQFIEGRELAVSVLDGGDDERPLALPVVEAVPEGEDFYDFTARYEIGRARFVCPADLEDAVAQRASEVALEVWNLLGCRGFARVDMILAAEGVLQMLEVNAVPGLTATSLLPQAAEAAGIGFDDLIERILTGALARGA